MSTVCWSPFSTHSTLPACRVCSPADTAQDSTYWLVRLSYWPDSSR